MTITAPVQGFSLAALARLVSLPLPSAAPPSAQSRSPDVVVFSSAPFRLLSDLAATGLRQLTTLLPALEQALQGDSAAPLGHLAKAAGAAARQITEGHVALLAEGPERVAASLRGELSAPATDVPPEARQLLRTLARQLGTPSDSEPNPEPRTTETLRTAARQLGMEGRLATPSSAGAESGPEPRTTETPRTVARQTGVDDRLAPPRGSESGPDAPTNETLRTVARQIGMDGRLAAPRSAEPNASPIQRWLADAELVLRGTSDALDRAEQHLAGLPPAATPEAPSAWALAQVTAAQVLVTAACGSLAQSSRVWRGTTATATATALGGSFAIGADRLAAATTMFGMLIVLVTLWLAGGVWSLVTGFAGLLAVGVWVLRISRASKGVSLDARR